MFWNYLFHKIVPVVDGAKFVLLLLVVTQCMALMPLPLAGARLRIVAAAELPCFLVNAASRLADTLHCLPVLPGFRNCTDVAITLLLRLAFCGVSRPTSRSPYSKRAVNASVAKSFVSKLSSRISTNTK